MVATFVYRCFCSHDTLLYVGVATNVERRLRQHARKAWWPEVARVDALMYLTRLTALKVEAWHIVYDNPRYNVAGRPDRPPLPEHIGVHYFAVEEDGYMGTTYVGGHAYTLSVAPR